MTKLMFKLTKAAKKAGGDRYEADTGEPRPMVIYLPQSISRHPSGIFKEMEIVITPKGD